MDKPIPDTHQLLAKLTRGLAQTTHAKSSMKFTHIHIRLANMANSHIASFCELWYKRTSIKLILFTCNDFLGRWILSTMSEGCRVPNRAFHDTCQVL